MKKVKVYKHNGRWTMFCKHCPVIVAPQDWVWADVFDMAFTHSWFHRTPERFWFPSPPPLTQSRLHLLPHTTTKPPPTDKSWLSTEAFRVTGL